MFRIATIDYSRAEHISQLSRQYVHGCDPPLWVVSLGPPHSMSFNLFKLYLCHEMPLMNSHLCFSAASHRSLARICLNQLNDRSSDKQNSTHRQAYRLSTPRSDKNVP